jgi:alpha-galactosidase
VVGTKFIYPDDPSVKTRLQEVWSYPPEKQVVWKKWFDLYDRLRLSEGEYCNLYDTAFDRPEAHAIRKEGRMYYAFFADEYDGDLELRGLETGDYRIFDYANNLSLGLVSGAHPILHTSFRQSLLLFAEPALKS